MKKLSKIEIRALQYITNNGNAPKIECFDEDYEPAGPLLRKQLSEAGFVKMFAGRVLLTDEGEKASKKH